MVRCDWSKPVRVGPDNRGFLDAVAHIYTGSHLSATPTDILGVVFDYLDSYTTEVQLSRDEGGSPESFPLMLNVRKDEGHTVVSFSDTFIDEEMLKQKLQPHVFSNNFKC
jgi:hypothetical protein